MSEEIKTEPTAPPDRLAELRKPFPAKAIGSMQRANVTLSYVGHAAVTDRLLSVDPLWNWEPLTWETEGPFAGGPRFVRAGAGNPIGLWIKLTVCGVTRLGYGSVLGNAFDPEKQLIGDAIRNAAMRFGVALELWSRDELESQLDEEPSESLKDAREHAKKANAAPRGKPLTQGEKEEVDEVLGAPAGTRQALTPRMVCGVSVWRTWESLKDDLIGAKAAKSGPGVPSAKDDLASKTWQWASEGSDGGERATWLVYLVQRAREQYAKNPTEPLRLELQAAALAYSAMLDRISPDPFKGDEATCPTQESEV